MVDRLKIEQLVKEKLLVHMDSHEDNEPLDFVNEQHIRSLDAKTKYISVTNNAVITTLARDLAEANNVELRVVTGSQTLDSSPQNPKCIAIGCDHGGLILKKLLVSELRKWGYEVCDVGTHSADSVDYPDFAYAVAKMISQKSCANGIVIDGAGIGSAITANKVPGIRAAHCHNLFEIKNSKEHNNANVLSLGARVIGEGLAIEMVKTWLETPFAGGRHQRRVDKIMATEKKYLRG
ncbi:ribose 5-phosphate isomerase B [Candidatus Uabimicrobium sp. HlEnr_7]|uniref:ribose 5-phosphate isomerase B n=1 Tax=Candidatus Uabimicrobium helgolandensis TaxID=3095367 RepID=UPI003558C383